MKVDLIGMILSYVDRRVFDGLIIDDDGRELDAEHSLDHMILEYAKIKAGGTSETVVVRKLAQDETGAAPTPNGGG